MGVDLKQLPRVAKGGSLVAIVGAPAAAMLLSLVPLEESGRTVQVEITRDGATAVRHVSGPQYLTAYLDIAGVATACDGLTQYQGRAIKKGMRFTEAQCASMLEQELAAHAATVMACTRWDKDRHPHQIVATVSMDYNTGGWCGSTAARRVAAGDVAGGCEALLMWDKATVGGRKVAVKGLTRRRHREREYCITNVLPGATAANLAKRLEAWK